MKGLELCRSYWENIGLPSLEDAFPQVLPRIAVGLVGEGSDCFGYDDPISQDHDWGPGFCLWLSPADHSRFGVDLSAWYAALPQTFMSFSRLRQTDETAGRVGVMEIGSFYSRYLGLNRPPRTIEEWRYLPESGLAVTTNGEIFRDGPGDFTTFRSALLAYYPEDVRRKRLAAVCAAAAQAGQYNYARCLARKDRIAALTALSIFIDRVQSAVFLLNRRYRPYYKWTQRAMATLPGPGGELASLIDTLAEGDIFRKQDAIEEISASLIRELQHQGLSTVSGDYLLPHAQSIQAQIRDDALRSAHLMGF